MLGFVAAIALLACVAWAWLLYSTSGARFIVARAESTTGLAVADIDGAIASGLRFRGVRFASGNIDVSLAELTAKADIDVLPLSIRIVDASAQAVRVAIMAGDNGDDGATAVAPGLDGLVLPFPLHVDDVRITDIEIDVDGRVQAIEELGLTATWYEDIRLRRVVVRSAEIDVEGEAAINPANAAAITADLRASLKPALTQLGKPLSVRLRGEGDLAGASVLATLGALASIEADLRWRDGFEAAADVTLDGLDLAEFVADWPAGFPLVGTMQASVDASEFALRDASFEIGDTGARVRIDAGMQRADGRVEGQVRWENMRWPLGVSEARVRSEFADLRLSGTVDDWSAAGSIALEGRDLPRGVFEIDGTGTRDGARGRIVDSKVLGGRIAGEVAYTWSGTRPWMARLDFTNVHLAWLLPDWPAVVSGRLDSKGTGEPFALHAILEDVDGELRGESLQAGGIVDIENGNVVVNNLRVEHAGSVALLNGELMAPAGLRFDARVADLARYVENVTGGVAATGVMSLAGEGFLDATLDSPSVLIGDLAITDIEARVEASDAGQSLSLAGAFGETPVQLLVRGAFDDWRKPLESRFEGQLSALEVDLGDEHSMTLSAPASIAFTTAEVAVDDLCLVDKVGTSVCADARWRQGADYGAELTLQDVPLDIIEHVSDVPLTFEQRVTGTFVWRQRPGAGPRGSGRLTLSPGSVALADDPTSAAATGNGVFDFEIEEGRLLRGDVLLPFPGRGEVAGDFSVTDVRLGTESDVQGNLVIDISEIRVLSKLFGLVDNASGQFEARAKLDGTIAEPSVTAEFSLAKGGFTYRPIGLELSDVNLNGTMDTDFRFDLSGTFRAGRGIGEIVSRADYSNADDPGLMFRLKGEDLTFVNVPDVFVEADADVDIALDRDTLSVNGTVTVPNALIKPRNITISKISESEDVVVVAGELPDPPEEEQRESELEYMGELNVALGDSVVVDLDVAKASVTGAVNFQWQGAPMPIANGRYLIEGTIAAFGQVLDISEGSVHFPKVPADQPHIRVVAEREIYGNTQVKRAGVLIDGPVRRPIVEAFTQPLTTEERALALLVTGSDFDYEQGVGAIDFGTYIAPRLFVSYGVGVFDRENIISARFDLARGFGIKASSGGKESGVDLNYRFEN